MGCCCSAAGCFHHGPAGGGDAFTMDHACWQLHAFTAVRIPVFLVPKHVADMFTFISGRGQRPNTRGLSCILSLGTVAFCSLDCGRSLLPNLQQKRFSHVSTNRIPLTLLVRWTEESQHRDGRFRGELAQSSGLLHTNGGAQRR